MNPTLFKAILAMDAYNRGNAPGLLNLGGSQLGIATILPVALPTGEAVKFVSSDVRGQPYIQDIRSFLANAANAEAAG